jgi:hypothetical protein
LNASISSGNDKVRNGEYASQNSHDEGGDEALMMPIISIRSIEVSLLLVVRFKSFH